MRSACTKSCEHRMQESIVRQERKLVKQRYPQDMIEEQKRRLAVKFLHNEAKDEEKEEQRTASIPFYHTLSHSLMKIGQKYDMRTVFSFPTKMSKLVSGNNRTREECQSAVSTHTNYVSCSTACVYSIPLTCGKEYRGQTMKCINERITQHQTNLKNMKPKNSTLVQHAEKCRCQTLPTQSRVLGGRSQSRLQREIWEAFMIRSGGETVISETSISLMEIEYEALLASETTEKKFIR
jgi:hypothetical protein